MALRQNAIASAGAAVAAMIGPDVDTASSATTRTARSGVAGITSAVGGGGAGTRRVSPMDAAATSALIDEAAKKSGLLWLRAPGPGRHAQAMWHLWQDGAAYVLTGGIEQPAPDDVSDTAFVTLRSKDKGARLVTFEVSVSVVEPGSEQWSAVESALVAKRLNLPDGQDAPLRWARECTLWRLEPTGAVVETPDEPTTNPHVAAPPPTPARSRVPRPLHLRGRPSRNKGGR
jgi:hypothetical protein